MRDSFSEKIIRELLKTKRTGLLYHREGRNLEFKESFNHAAWSEYLVDFAAFSNHTGGYLIFGVTNSPRKLVGLKKKHAKMFSDIDEGFISGEINKLFSPYIDWSKKLVTYKRNQFGVIYIKEAKEKPVIAGQSEGDIKNGEIYYRYAGRTQKIEFAELNSIIQDRIEAVNKNWQSLISKISKIGPANAAILDTERGIIKKDKGNILVLDKKLLDKVKFIKEGAFTEKEGATALRLSGEVSPIDSVEVVKIEKRKLIEEYPLTYKELEAKIKKKCPKVKQYEIYQAIKENDIKNDKKYSAYNFRSKMHEDQYIKSGKITASTASIYNQAVVNFLVKVLGNK